VIAHHKVEWGSATCRVMLCIMDEFGKRKHGGPSGLVIGTEDAKVNFEFLVNLFSFSITLGVEGGGKGVLIS
jgi:hypothetical protein